nr:hypothetical protein BHI3_04710 [Bacteriovorax sp. HI3]
MKNFFLISLLFIIACSSSETDSGAYTKSATVENHLSKTLKAPWKEIDNQGSDLALSNTKTNSFFIFNSACRRYDQSNLPTLTNSILSGISNVEISEKTIVSHQGRDASLVIAKGAVDGVERYFRILTTQKNNCIYDFALISTGQKNLDKDTPDFNKFIELLKLN